MKDLIGKKIKGFAFEDKVHDGLHYNPKMDNYIDQIGFILRYTPSKDSYTVRFKNTKEWMYPAKLIEDYIIYNFPHITISIPMLCSDNGEQWVQDEILCQLPDNAYLSKDLYTWTFVKPLNETV
jgi:hypothetical protein